MSIPKSELILNEDLSVYHLNLRPGEVAETIITVGDQERVEQVSKFFDQIELKKQKREFCCHTGRIGKKRLSVISTGIGTDNIDIVFNEIDALFNIDLATRTIKDELTELRFIRLGTSGALNPDIPLGQFLISETAIGIDNLNLFYIIPNHLKNLDLQNEIDKTLDKEFNAYAVRADEKLCKLFSNQAEYIYGNTLTSIGFYGPQGRSIRNKLKNPEFIDTAASLGITNLEMETSGIYLLTGNLGHSAISINAILANRKMGTFASNPGQIVDRMIERSLEILFS